MYDRAVAALQLQDEAPAVPSAGALALVRAVLEDMGGDGDAAHEFLLVDPAFPTAVCGKHTRNPIIMCFSGTSVTDCA